ncbi:disease resistance protein RUN1-like [Ziziphus jujuba]|uniref:ADP-ribosyl cyclase/cyclic ADP-ribose hydrolase n=1 Tax=Ziziphus jujuba TaxID=326968 RepID=A0ABM4A531_ZIZJJ|nr:disease resistance protein RUN1-like [Ziziphus jujuba]
MERPYSSPSSSSSSNSKPPPKKYDVFLSFRGEDTRNSFTSFLLHALKEKGIHDTFIDDELKSGKDISAELLKTIEESSCSIIVLSTNYANSTWCLKEFVKILDCRNTMEHIVLPIFFPVEPTHVQNKTGTFEEAFNELKEMKEMEKAILTENERQNIEKELKRWEDSLTQVGGISGFPLTERERISFSFS